MCLPHMRCCTACCLQCACCSATILHRLQANKFSDPVTGEDVVMLIQTDVTARVVAMRQVQQVLNAEQGLLEGIFPRQVRVSVPCCCMI